MCVSVRVCAWGSPCSTLAPSSGLVRAERAGIDVRVHVLCCVCQRPAGNWLVGAGGSPAHSSTFTAQLGPAH